MTKHAQLNNLQHRDLRIITKLGAEYGDNVMGAITFPAEFRNVQAHYPILFMKSPEGVFTPLALFGLHEKQNLFLNGNHWDAHYVPLMIERQPFLIGASAGGQVVHIDMDSPRVSKTEGEPVFREHGGNSEFLDRISVLLGTIHDGLAATPAFLDAVLEHNLLESFVLDIKFGDGAEFRFGGFYTIQEEKLAKLDAAALGKLHEKGHLQAIYMVIASLSQFRDLIERASRLDADKR